MDFLKKHIVAFCILLLPLEPIYGACPKEPTNIDAPPLFFEMSFEGIPKGASIRACLKEDECMYCSNACNYLNYPICFGMLRKVPNLSELEVGVFAHDMEGTIFRPSYFEVDPKACTAEKPCSETLKQKKMTAKNRNLRKPVLYWITLLIIFAAFISVVLS